MALNYSTNPTFFGRITAADANYPYGSSKDESSPGANDGMPHIKQRADDLLGFMQALLKQASPEIVPSGSADTAVASQYVDAIRSIINNESAAQLNGQAGSYYLDLANATGVLASSKVQSAGLDADTLDGQEGSWYQSLANATGTLSSGSITGDFAQSRITNLVSDLAAKATVATNLSAGSSVGASGYYQLGNLLINFASGTVDSGNSPLTVNFSQAFDAVVNAQLTAFTVPTDVSPSLQSLTNSSVQVVRTASSGPLSIDFHLVAFGWKS